MARNRFDVDETLETPFNIKHLLRAGVYIKRHKQKMILSLVFSAISAASAGQQRRCQQEACPGCQFGMPVPCSHSNPPF